MEIIDTICSKLLTIAAFLNLYTILYKLIGVFFKAKNYPETDKKFKYAVVIPARNEERVIGNLISSIRGQSYDSRLITVFVLADRCADRTAEISKSLGAVVYERNEPDKARKGYALEYLFDQIEKDYGIQSFDGYFFFDADNLLSPTFIEEMNKAFASGARAVTGYRNTKNFDTSFISGAYGIHFYNNSVERHRPRSLLGVGTHLTGTGYLLHSGLLAGGWHYTNFTEDDQLTMVLACMGVKVEYCEAAEFFDEQPCDFRTVLRQRIRWAKGRLTAFFRHGFRTFLSIFKYKSFTSYDMFCFYFPYGLFTWLISLVYPLCSFVYGIIHKTYDYGHMLQNVAATFAAMYVNYLFAGIYTVAREWRHIRCGALRTAFYVLLYPWYSLITVYVYIAAIFINVKWLPIIHSDSRKIDDLMRPLRKKTHKGASTVAVKSNVK